MRKQLERIASSMNWTQSVRLRLAEEFIEERNLEAEFLSYCQELVALTNRLPVPEELNNQLEFLHGYPKQRTN